jgi:hypothetical protein
MSTITINGTQYKIKYTLRALFIFEAITKKSFTIDSITDNYIFLFALILANNPDTELSWEEFINALDDNPNLFNEMSKIIEKQQENQKLFEDNGNEGNNNGKKK